MNRAEAPSGISKKMLAAGIAILFVVICFTFGTIIKKTGWSTLRETIAAISPVVILSGLFMMCIYSFCEGLNMYRVLKLAGCDVKLRQTFRYAVAGFFYSGITPSSSGGQPMQLYYMYRDQIPVPHGLCAVFMQLFGHQAGNVAFGLTGFVLLNRMLTESVGKLKYFMLFGIVLNSAYLLFLCLCLFSRRAIDMFGRILAAITKRADKKGNGRLAERMTEAIGEYERLHLLLKKDRSIIWKTVLTGLAQFFCAYSIPVIVYHGLGFSGHHFMTIELMQGVVQSSAGYLPVPGSAGVSEGLIFQVFQTLYPERALGSAVLTGRCLNMYLFVIVCGAMCVLFRCRHFLYSRKRRTADAHFV